MPMLSFDSAFFLCLKSSLCLCHAHTCSLCKSVSACVYTTFMSILRLMSVPMSMFMFMLILLCLTLMIMSLILMVKLKLC